MDTFDDIQQSYGRCLRADDNFVGLFYRKLLARDERIRAMFESTDWERQQKAVRRGISLMITFAGTPAIARRQVAEIAAMHSRKGHAPVPPELYPHWIESLIEAAGETDPKFDQQLEQRWREAIRPGIDLFIAEY